MADDWTPQDHRLARKMVRRYALTGRAFSARNWMREVRVARLAIALGLVAFFERLREEATVPAEPSRGECEVSLNDIGCSSAFGEKIRTRCYVCSRFACKSSCSKLRVRRGRRARVCNDCIHDEEHGCG